MDLSLRSQIVYVISDGSGGTVRMYRFVRYAFLLFADAVCTKILWAGLYNFERASVPQTNYRFAIGPFIHLLYISRFASHMKSEICVTYCKGCRNCNHIKCEPRLFMSFILISLITISLPSKRLHYKTQNVIYIYY